MAIERLSSHETYPAPLPAIIARFDTRLSVEDAMLPVPDLFLAAIYSTPFEPQTPPEKCPFHRQIIAEALLVGFHHPMDLERLNRTLCGAVVSGNGPFNRVDGFQERSYRPFSQCWKLTGELHSLVEFMDQDEYPPAGPVSMSDEDLRVYLNTRHDLEERNAAREKVFFMWKNSLPGITGLLGRDYPQPPLLADGGVPSSSAPDSHLAQPVLPDVSWQFQIHGEEYHRLVDWVKGQVLTPMVRMVGEYNLNFSLRNITFEDSARNCPQKPHGGFSGPVRIAPLVLV